jgi:hypothetical protein
MSLSSYVWIVTTHVSDVEAVVVAASCRPDLRSRIRES